MTNEMKVRAFFTVSGKRRLGVPVKINNKTMWIKVMKGAKTYFIIKRHFVKHNFQLIYGGTPE